MTFHRLLLLMSLPLLATTFFLLVSPLSAAPDAKRRVDTVPSHDVKARGDAILPPGPAFLRVSSTGGAGSTTDMNSFLQDHEGISLPAKTDGSQIAENMSNVDEEWKTNTNGKPRSLPEEGDTNSGSSKFQQVLQSTTGGVDWTLSTCCNTVQIWFLCLFAGFLVINFFLWNTFLMKPMKLLAVFVHEMSHATATWLTCGEVKAIEVYNNEGGVTKYVGGQRCIIIPAGYLGGAFWGGVFVALSGDRIAATAIASLMAVSLIVSLFYAPNKVMVLLSLGFVTITVAVILLDWFVIDPLVQFLTLYYGVFIGSFSVYDIYDDLITRTVEGSDAHACHQLIPCCMPRCVGIQFAVVAIIFQAAGMYFALVFMS